MGEQYPVWRCKHGKKFRDCVDCVLEWFEEDDRLCAEKAMHTLLVWLFCNSVSSLDDELAAWAGVQK